MSSFGRDRPAPTTRDLDGRARGRRGGQAGGRSRDTGGGLHPRRPGEMMSAAVLRCTALLFVASHFCAAARSPKTSPSARDIAPIVFNVVHVLPSRRAGRRRSASPPTTRSGGARRRSRRSRAAASCRRGRSSRASAISSGQHPLTERQIALIEQWVEDGRAARRSAGPAAACRLGPTAGCSASPI